MEKEYRVEGMHCSACVHSLEQLISQHPDVQKVTINLIDKKLFLKAQKEIDLSELNQLVSQGGYFLKDSQDDEVRFKIPIYGIIVYALVLMILGMFFMHAIWAEWAMAVLSSVLIYQGRDFYVRAYRQAKIRQTSMDTLVAISTGIAYGYSWVVLIIKIFDKSVHYETHFEAAGMIIGFVLVGKYLEEKAQKRTQKSLWNILQYKNKKILKRLKDGSFTEIEVNQIQVEDVILIKAGEQIPVDGQVVEGETYVEESMLTGEFMPVHKKNGDRVLAGTMNQNHNILVKAQKTGGDTFIEQILKEVEKAQSTKPEIQKVTDKVAGQFALWILGISVMTWVGWSFYGRVEQGFIAMISVMVIACPCALGLATPMAVVIGIGNAAKKGILVRNANVFQVLTQITTFVLDKTGTLTEGKPSVETILWRDSNPKVHWEVLWLKLAQQSNHPLANAIYQYFNVNLRNSNTFFLTLQKVQTFPGRGVQAQLDEDNYFMGNKKFLLENQIEISEDLKKALQAYPNQGKSLVYFARNQECLGVAVLSDKIREDALRTVKELQKMGYEVMILSGDQPETVSFYAQKLGIQEYEGNLMPMQKAKRIAKMKMQGKKVVMVGDGINDAVALSKADASFAMGGGSELASNVAEVVLIHNHLSSILEMLGISKQTFKLIYQNLFWAFIYNLLMIPLAAGVFYSLLGWQFEPMWASAAMSLSSISVVLNSLRFRK